jgi:methyl-accepting chemotaxis protein
MPEIYLQETGMFNFWNASRERAAKLEAVEKSQAVVEFDLAGTILWANENFLSVMGYTLPEIRGKHHSLFVDPAYRDSAEYRDLWKALNRGDFQAAEFKRIGKGGKEVWIQASYNPIRNRAGKPYKVVKVATDVTARKLKDADYAGQIRAMAKSQPVIEFNLDGTVISANQNFLDAMGYTLDEIRGKHHGLFVDDVYRASDEYRDFWASLNRGEFRVAEFKRIGKGGREVWIQASYNPILDMNGKPFKVVKYAADVTKQVTARIKNEQARLVIEEKLAAIDTAITRASEQSAVASDASRQTSTNVQLVASGAEQLSASVRKIADSMAKSRAEADEAFARVAAADQATERMTNAARAMTNIVELIQTIAGQINLLALNATIESARAGEAGRGFAVVATEVKTLAKQAADATDQIKREIDGIQGVSDEVVVALSTIKQSIVTVRDYVASTAGAIEEQSTVAHAMSANMHTAATAVESISSGLGLIAGAAYQAEGATKEARQQLDKLIA